MLNAELSQTQGALDLVAANPNSVAAGLVSVGATLSIDKYPKVLPREVPPVPEVSKLIF